METSLVLERPGAHEPLQLAEGRLALGGPAFRLQLLLDRPHLASSDPLGLISGGRRGDRQPALTFEAWGRHWDVTVQGVRAIDNPGPDGDLAAVRIQGWWPGARAAVTAFRLEAGMLGGGGASAGRILLQELASVEGYVDAGPVELGLQAVQTRTAGWNRKPLGPLEAVGAGLVRLRTLPWRPSAAVRLEAGLFQTGEGFRSLAALEQRLPAGAAGFWTEARLRHGSWRWDGRLLHARLDSGGTELEAALEGRLSRGGLTWTAGLEGSRARGPEGGEEDHELQLGLSRPGRWEVAWRAGRDRQRLVFSSRLGSWEGRAGLDAAAGGTIRVELRRRETPWGRLVWKARRSGDPNRHLYFEAGHELESGWFASMAVGRWDRGRSDAVWGLPERISVTIGRRF